MTEEEHKLYQRLALCAYQLMETGPWGGYVTVYVLKWSILFPLFVHNSPISNYIN
jgi:hypothetical protein